VGEEGTTTLLWDAAAAGAGEPGTCCPSSDEPWSEERSEEDEGEDSVRSVNAATMHKMQKE